MLNKILEKLLSGRWLATVAMIFTYCFIVCFVTISYCSSISRNADKLESFAMGLIVGFSGLAGIVIKSYFDKKAENEKAGV